MFFDNRVGVAQLVEHGTHKPGVVGSIPTSDIMLNIKSKAFSDGEKISVKYTCVGEDISPPQPVFTN